MVNRHRYWRREAIVADLDGRQHPFHVAIENWQHDLNIGTVVRNADAFLAAEVHIVGSRRYLFPTEKFRGEWKKHWIHADRAEAT